MPTELERAAAVNSYVYQYLVRTHRATATSGYDVLRSGEAVCGGMVTVMAEMLYTMGIRSRYAFTVGGNAAHSMVEVYFANGTQGLFDPYHGVMYFDRDSNSPVSILEIERYSASGSPPVLYAREGNPSEPRPVHPMTSLFDTYHDFDGNNRTNYQFPEIFTGAENLGIANSGIPVVIRVGLSPDQLLGRIDWQPSEEEPRPWTVLSKWQRAPGDYLSWAYIMGTTGLGYLVEHAYQLEGLVPGEEYELAVYVANAYAPPHAPSLEPTVHVTDPSGQTLSFELQAGGYSSVQYTPQAVQVSFVATDSSMTLHASAEANLVIAGIGLATTSV